MSTGQDDQRITTDDLPILHGGTLDDAALGAYRRDLDACAQILDVRLKSAARTMSTSETPSLDEALESFMSGAALGVQIRYRHEHAIWLDTLTRVGSEVRIARIQMPHGAGGSARGVST